MGGDSGLQIFTIEIFYIEKQPIHYNRNLSLEIMGHNTSTLITNVTKLIVYYLQHVSTLTITVVYNSTMILYKYYYNTHDRRHIVLTKMSGIMKCLFLALMGHFKTL